MSAGAVAVAITVAFLAFFIILAVFALAATRAGLLASTLKRGQARPPAPKETKP